MARLTGDWFVAEAKITRYLLDLAHKRGAPKARFFAAFGFLPDRFEVLLAALREHPAENEIAGSEQTAFGRKTIVQCRVQTPDGRNPCIRTIWIQDKDEAIHRFVTAITRAASSITPSAARS